MLLAKNKRRRTGNAPRKNYAFRSRKSARAVQPETTHILEFNPETEASLRESRRVRRRRGFRAAVLLIACMGFVALGRLVVKEAFMDNERFHLQRFIVTTEGQLTEDQIISATGLELGTNMLMISLTTVRERLEALPEVRHAGVRREYPGLLTLDVEQRKPVALLVSVTKSDQAKNRNAGCLLDADGVMLPNFKMDSQGGKLPRITVDKMPRINSGRRVDSVPALAALKLMEVYRGSEINRSMEITSIDATRRFGLLAGTSRPGLTVMFGCDEFEKQIRRLGQVMASAAKTNRTPVTINLVVKDNVPVTFRDADTAAATTLEKRLDSRQRALASAD